MKKADEEMRELAKEEMNEAKGINSGNGRPVERFFFYQRMRTMTKTL